MESLLPYVRIKLRALGCARAGPAYRTGGLEWIARAPGALGRGRVRRIAQIILLTIRVGKSYHHQIISSNFFPPCVIFGLSLQLTLREPNHLDEPRARKC